MKTKEQLAADAIRKVVKDLNSAVQHAAELGLGTRIDVLDKGAACPVLSATVVKEV